MKNLIDYLSNINEGIKLPNDKLNLIENVLNKHLSGKYFSIDIKEIFDIERKERQHGTAYGFETSDELLADVAGYLVEVFVWTKLKNELFFDEDFLNEWYKDIANTNKGSLSASNEMSPLVRRAKKGQYWDFTLPGVDEKFEIKSRSIKNGKSGGLRYTTDQNNDNNLIYIIVKYEIKENAINIQQIEVKRK